MEILCSTKSWYQLSGLHGLELRKPQYEFFQNNFQYVKVGENDTRGPSEYTI
jgi:hypothetical protein